MTDHGSAQVVLCLHYWSS